MHFRLVSLTWVADHIPQLAMAAIAFAGLLSVYLYLSSFAGKKLLAEHGTSGNAVYDFYMGRELNPRILAGTLDLKFMCELRPGLIGWAVINAACALKYVAHARAA